MRILSNAPPQVVRVSEAYLKEDVKDVVITIPSYYTHVERSAIVAGDTLLLPILPFKCLTKKITRVPAAADIAGVNLLSLVLRPHNFAANGVPFLKPIFSGYISRCSGFEMGYRPQSREIQLE